MKPDHVKKFEESISYPEYTEEDKKRGMNKPLIDKKITPKNGSVS